MQQRLTLLRGTEACIVRSSGKAPDIDQDLTRVAVGLEHIDDLKAGLARRLLGLELLK